jgi:hypothetical protein
VLVSSFANLFHGVSLASAGAGSLRDVAVWDVAAAPTFVAGLPGALRNLTLRYDNAGITLPALSLSGNLSVTARGNISDSGNITVMGTTTLAPGSGNDITLDNANDFSAVAVASGRNVTLIEANAINLGASTVSGNLSVTAPGGIAVTAAPRAGSLALNGPVALNATGTTANPSVRTAGGQTYGGAMTLGAPTVLEDTASGAITFNATVNGAQRLEVNTAGATTLGGAVGGATPLMNVETDNAAAAGGSKGGSTTINGNITTTGHQTYNDAVSLGANATLTGTALQLGAVVGNNRNLTLNNSGTGALNGAVSGVNYLAANGNGLLAVNSMLSAGSVSVNPGATLGGNGAISAPVVVQSGGTLSPGTSMGSLTISKSLTLLGTAFMELNKSSLTNDFVRGMTSIIYDGSLNVINLGGTLAAGDAFRLFDATAYSGAFGNFSLPTIANGLVWDASSLTSNGVLRVVSSPPPRFTSIAATGPHTIQVTATGVANQNYWLLATTNLALPTSNWWLAGMTNATTNGNILLLDTTATGFSRLYRLAQ